MAALENAVSTYPALEGRFPQVSNITFEFDPSLPPDNRIKWTKLGGKPIDLEQKYVVVTRGYMGRGKDGFDSLLVESEGGQAEEIVSEENGILISMMLRQYFMSLKILGRWKHWGKSLNRHWEGIHEDLHSTHPVVEPNTEGKVETGSGEEVPTAGTTTPLDDSEDEEGQHRVEEAATKWSARELQIIRRVMRKWRRVAGLKGQPNCCDSVGEGEFTVDWTRVSPIHRFVSQRLTMSRLLHLDWKAGSRSLGDQIVDVVSCQANGEVELRWSKPLKSLAVIDTSLQICLWTVRGLLS